MYLSLSYVSAITKGYSCTERTKTAAIFKLESCLATHTCACTHFGSVWFPKQKGRELLLLFIPLFCFMSLSYSLGTICSSIAMLMTPPTRQRPQTQKPAVSHAGQQSKARQKVSIGHVSDPFYNTTWSSTCGHIWPNLIYRQKLN